MANLLQPITSEVQANTTTFGAQEHASMTRLTNGNIVVIWHDDNPLAADDDDGAIRGRLFSGDGVALSAEFIINTTINLDQSEPEVTALDGGGFVVAWNHAGTDIYAQMFTAAGSMSGSEIVVDAGFASHPAIAAIDGGGFVVTWEDGQSDPDGSAIVAEIYNASGGVDVSAFVVNTDETSHQSTPNISRLGDGFVVTWTDFSEESADDSDGAIRAQIFTSAGATVGGELLVNTTTPLTQWNPDLVELANGNFVVVWADEGVSPAIRARIVSPTGSPVSSEIEVDPNVTHLNFTPTVAALDNGGFVVVWQHESGIDTEVHAQIFNADGDKVGAVVEVNTGNLNNLLAPSITPLDNGGFAIGWSGVGEVKARFYDIGEAQAVDDIGSIFADADLGMFDALANDTPSDVAAVISIDGVSVTSGIAGLDQSDLVVDIISNLVSIDLGADFDKLGVDDTATIDIDYTMEDPFGVTKSATLTVTVNGVNDAPIALNKAFSLFEGNITAGNVLNGVTDADGDAFSITAVNFDPDKVGVETISFPSFLGTLTLFVDGSFFYRADKIALQLSGGESQVDTFSFTVTDDEGASVSKTLAFTVNGLDNVIYGTSGNDNLVGAPGKDIIYGEAGNDSIAGGFGDDVMFGGAGNDTYLLEDLDEVFELENEGIDLVKTSGSFVLFDNVENLTLLAFFPFAIDGTGNDLANTIIGTIGPNKLDGRAGNDKLIGGKGDDIYFVDSTADVVTELAGQGLDEVRSSAANLMLGLNVENLVLLAGGVNGTGNAASNKIAGNDAANKLDGGAGDDIIDGGGGADVLIGGVGNDVFKVDDVGDVVTEAAGGGIDTMKISVSFTLAPQVENLVLLAGAIEGTGNGLNNIITGNDDDNVLDGGAGNDVIEGMFGADKMSGGAGNDKIFVDNKNDTVIELVGGGIDEVWSSIDYTLGPNVENLFVNTTTKGTGNALNNIIMGAEVNNVLDGGAGIDKLIGNLGNDTYLVDNPADLVVEVANQGNDTVISTALTYTLAPNVENLTLGVGASNGTGNASNNLLVGNTGNNVLDGAAGHDTLNGGGGTDELRGGLGNDVYVIDGPTDSIVEMLNAGTDTVFSTASNYTLAPSVENLTLLAGAGDGTGNASNNHMIGNDLANVLIGKEGNDILDGGKGVDQLAGGTGSDTYYVDDPADDIDELLGQGTDTVNSTASTFTLPDHVENLVLAGDSDGTGNALDNAIIGGTGANKLDGAAGNDIISGGADADELTGGAGVDQLAGGFGEDIFHYAALSEGGDRILDFKSADDTIEVEAAGFANAVAGSTVLVSGGAPAAANGDAAFLYDTDDGRLFYDADGNGAGAAQLLAVLAGHPTILAADIVIV